MTVVVADIPNPIGVVTDVIGEVGGWAFDKVAEGIANWVLDAVEFFVNGAIDFLSTSSTPNVGAVWFSGPGSPYAAVRDVAAVLLVGFVFLGIIQGLVHGDAAGMLRRIAGNLPAAVAGMVLMTAVVGYLLQLTDAASDAVLANTDDQALHFLSGFGATVTSVTNGFAAVLLGIVAVIAGLLLWVELIIRASLVYILVAVSPLGFAATVWPSARGVLRKTVELLLAVIVSKLVICIALAIGVAALSGAGTAGTPGEGLASNAGSSLGALLVGAVLLGLAAFSPFIVLKLVPVAEAAIVAQGVSRGPWRAAQSTMSAAYSAGTLTRLAGGSGQQGRPGPGGPAGMPGTQQRAPGASATTPAGGGASTGTGGGVAGRGAQAAAGPAGVGVAAGGTVVSGAARTARDAADASTAGTDTGGSGRSPADAPRRDGDDRD